MPPSLSLSSFSLSLSLHPNMASSSSSHKRKRHRIITPPVISTTTEPPLQQQTQQKHTKNNQQNPNLLSRLGLGIVSALYAFSILTTLMVVAFLLGFGAVTVWVEEPVFVRERLYFDYAEAWPVAVVRLSGSSDEGSVVPVGHGFVVQLVLVMPESDYNQEIGVFQVVTDLISTIGNVTARTSQPCMLKYRSLPIRLMRTFLMGVPLLIGLTSETQKMIIPVLNHKEKRFTRTGAIKVTLIPRPGTNFVPQIYEAEIILNSKLPWRKEIVRRWKWTFCVWTSLSIYVLLVLVLLSCFRNVIFPRVVEVEREEEIVKDEEKETDEGVKEGRLKDREVSEMLRKWRRRRSKRKAIKLFDDGLSDTIGLSSAPSVTITRDETLSDSGGVEDSESGCFA